MSTWQAGAPVRLPSWMTETGPLPILERLEQPRDAGGRFATYAELPVPSRTWRLAPSVPTSVVAVCCPECVYGDLS